MVLRWTAPSRSDLAGMVGFIRGDSQRAALKVAKSIRQMAAVLITFPRSGRIGEVPGTREPAVQGLPYIIVYDLPNDSVVRILRVRHGAQPYPPGRNQ